MQIQAQERAAEEDRRRNEAERLELDLEGGGGMLLDPVQLGFHEPEEIAAADTAPDEAAPEEAAPKLASHEVGGPDEAAPVEAAPKQDARGQAAAEAVKGDDTGRRGGDNQRGGSDASEREEDVIGRGAGATEKERTDERRESENDAARERSTGGVDTSASDNIELLNVEAEKREEPSRLESGPGEAGRDGEKVLQSRHTGNEPLLEDAASAEERDVIRMGRTEEGDLSRGAESTSGLNRQRPASGGTPGETHPPDTLVLGGATKTGAAAGVKLKPVELENVAPRLVGYRRQKESSSGSGGQGDGSEGVDEAVDESVREIEAELAVLEEEDTGGQGVDKRNADGDARENETEMRLLEEEDARPSS